MVSLWSDTLGHDVHARGRRCPATSMPTSPSSARATPVCGLRTRCARADPTLARRRVRARARRLRRVGPQRRMVLGVLRGMRGAQTSATTAATRAIAMQRAMFATLDEIERVVQRRRDRLRLGAWRNARGRDVPAHVERLDDRARGSRGPRVRRGRLSAGSNPTRRGQRIGCTPNLGALYTPHCAAIHPAKLVARARGRRRTARCPHLRAVAGGRDHDGAACARSRGTDPCRGRSSVRPRRSRRRSPGLKRALVPVYSLMIATEPLPDAFWASAGLRQRETFTDARRLVIYGQRTADGRFAFGGRGAPYHLGSRVQPEFDEDPARLRRARAHVARRCSRQLGDAAITHRWGGAVGVPRDWYSSVGFDRDDRHGLGGRLRRRRRRRPPISPAARSPISSSGTTPTSRICPGSGTSRRGGSPSRCAGPASTAPACW